ncbi:MAG: hypothetical protein R3C11_12585 [Planctomycetaceae bacterium]
MVRRLNQQLRGDEGEPKDFTTAFDRAQQLMNQLQDIKADWEAAQSNDGAAQTEKQQLYEDHLARTAAAEHCRGTAG